MEVFGSVAIVTGSTRGIGRGIALKLVESGAKIVVNYRSNEAAAAEMNKILRGIGADYIIIKADVSDYESAGKLVDEAISRFGKVDILVNNAGIYRAIRFDQLEWSEWDEIIRVNLYGVFNVTRWVVPHMIGRRRGVIINISSIASSIRSSKCIPAPGRVAYAASKSGVNGFTLALARELAPYNIRVNAIAPGLIDTEMARSIPKLNDRVKEIPIGRLGKPEDIGEAVLFIIKNDYITGEIVVVSGGE